MSTQCFFCKFGVSPNFKETENLERFLSARKKILSRERSGVCARHQRQLSHAIKYARFLALIPYVSYQGVK